MTLRTSFFIACVMSLASAISPAQNVSGLSISPNPVVAGSVATGTVTISKAAGSAGLKIKLTSSVTTTAEVPATVTVGAGSTSATFELKTSLVTATKEATIEATDPSGKTAKAVLTVDPPAVRLTELTLAPTSVSASKSAKGTLALSAEAPSGGFVVKLTSSAAYASVPASVTVAAGAKTGVFTIATTAVTANEKATIEASDPAGYSASAALTVELPTVRLTKLAISPTSVAAASPATGTVTLSAGAPAGGFVVNLSTTQSAIMMPGSVTVKAGAKTATFTIITSPITSPTTATVNAADTSGYTASASFSITVPKVRIASVSISPSPIPGGIYATGTVTLTGNAPVGGVVVNLSTMQSFVTLPSTVTVGAGTNSTTFAVGTAAVTSASSAMVSAAYPNGYSASAGFSVIPTAGLTIIDATELASFSPQTVTVAAGSTVYWTNTANSMSHTVTADVTGLGPVSGNLAPTQTFTWTVPANATSGTAYYYHCQYHGTAGNGKSLGSGMAGVILVK